MVTTLSTETSQVTNYNIGSVIRSIIDADAVISAQQEQETEDLVSQGIMNALYQLMNLEPAGPIGSTYLLNFALASTATSSVTEAAGTAIAVPNSTLQWQTGSSFTISPGQNVNVTATCTSTGTITNVPAGSITQLVKPVPGLTVTNPSAQPVVQGRDAQTQAQLQAALSQEIAQLHRGDQTSAESGVLTAALLDSSGNPTEQVVASKEVDYIPTTANPVNAWMYVYNGAGPMSSALLQQAQNVVNGYTDVNGVKHTGYKAAGIIMTVVDAPESTVNVSVAVLPKYGYSLTTVQTNVSDAISTYFAQLDLGQSLSITQFAFAILAAPGVADVQITTPAASLPAVPYVLTPPTPVLTAVTPTTATSLAAGTYDVAVTFTNVWGETTASTSASVTLTAGQEIQVSSITLPTGAQGVNYYMSVAVGSTTLGLVASGSGVQIDLTSLPVSGAVSPPASNTAQIQGNAYTLGTLAISEATS